MNELVLKQIDKLYVDEKTKSAVAALYHINASFSIDKTSVIVGPSGCGKTTLLKVITGLLDHDHGEILIDDQPIMQQQKIRTMMSFVSQETRLYPHMTVFDNIAFPLKMDKVPVDEIKHRVINLSKIVGIDHLLTRKPRHLSGGQQQKVVLARAIIKLPRFLLLDEPFSNLDIKNKALLKDFIITLKQELSLTIIMVTHHIEDAYGLVDDIFYMENGEIKSIERSVSHDIK